MSMSTDRSSFSIHMASVRSVSDAGVAVQIPALTGSGTVVMTRPLLPPSPGDYVMVAVSHDKTKFHWVNDDGSVGLAEAIFDAIAAADERSDGIAEDVYGYLWDEVEDLNNEKVDRAGDTMTGNLRIDQPNEQSGPQLILRPRPVNATTGGQLRLMGTSTGYPDIEVSNFGGQLRQDGTYPIAITESWTYTPSWTGLTPGSGEQNAARAVWTGPAYSGAHGTLMVSFSVELGSISGAVSIGLPAGYSHLAITGSGYVVLPGGWSTNMNNVYGICTWQSGGQVALLTFTFSLQNAASRVAIGATTPNTWSGSHFIRGSFEMQAIRP